MEINLNKIWNKKRKSGEMIEEIKLENWKTHKDSLMKFKKGTNLIVGIMGSGKSSVLDGISFGLFGTFPAMERKRVKLENIISYGESEAKLELKFNWSDEKYKIIRKIVKTKKKATTDAELYKDERIIEKGSNAVRKRIEEILGIEYELFTRAIYSEQNNIDYFLNLDPRKRKTEMDSLLGLDKFEKARSNIVSVINRIKASRKQDEIGYDSKKIEEMEKKIMEKNSESKLFEKNIYIQNYVVHPDFQKQGIGTTLMKEIMTQFQAQHVEKVHLFVERSNADVIAFYEKLGWFIRHDLEMMSIIVVSS